MKPTDTVLTFICKDCGGETFKVCFLHDGSPMAMCANFECKQVPKILVDLRWFWKQIRKKVKQAVKEGKTGPV